MLHTTTKWVEFDAGHRVPFHDSKCKRLHGHRYRVAATVVGAIRPADMNDSQSGMVADFGLIKKVLVTKVHDIFDHHTMLWADDPLVPIFTRDDILLDSLVVVDFIPTAENLAAYIFKTIKGDVEQIAHGLRLASVRVWETPTSDSEIFAAAEDAVR